MRFALRESLIAEVRELQRRRKVLRAHCGDPRLQIVPALAGHADLLVLDKNGKDNGPHYLFPILCVL